MQITNPLLLLCPRAVYYMTYRFCDWFTISRVAVDEKLNHQNVCFTEEMFYGFSGGFYLVLSLFQLISHLHDVVLRRDEAGNPIETKLHQISSDLYTVITNNLQVGADK